MKRNLPISKIMTADPITVHKGMKLSEVANILVEHQFHHVPVVDGKKVVGIISSTDLARVSYAQGVDSRQVDTVLDHTLSIEEVMRPGPVTVAKDDTVRDAAEILAKDWFHALPVVDGDDLVGIVTTTDVIKYLLEQY